VGGSGWGCDGESGRQWVRVWWWEWEAVGEGVMVRVGGSGWGCDGESGRQWVRVWWREWDRVCEKNQAVHTTSAHTVLYRWPRSLWKGIMEYLVVLILLVSPSPTAFSSFFALLPLSPLVQVLPPSSHPNDILSFLFLPTPHSPPCHSPFSPVTHPPSAICIPPLPHWSTFPSQLYPWDLATDWSPSESFLLCLTCFSDTLIVRAYPPLTCGNSKSFGWSHVTYE